MSKAAAHARAAAMAEPIRGNALIRLDVMEDRMRAILADPSVRPAIRRVYRLPDQPVQPALMTPEVLGLAAVDARSMLVDVRGRPL